jgi:hypothetical protein
MKGFSWFSGAPGESAFTKPFLVLPEIKNWNAELPEFFRRLSESADDRSYVVLAALVLEYHYDEALKSLMPGYDAINTSNDYTFSLKIETLSALKLVPSLIPRSAHCVRKIRNEFAHNLTIDHLDAVRADLLDRARTLYDEMYAPYKDSHQGKTLRQVFEKLVTGAITGLKLYRPNLNALRQRIDDPAFIDALQRDTERPSFEALRAPREDKPT